jgi:hypothetical protein
MVKYVCLALDFTYLRGVFRIKCAGQNNFNTNHFRSSAISGLIKACLVPTWTYSSQRSIYCQKAVADSFLLLIRVTPLQVLHEAALGQREVFWLRLCLSETEKGPPSRSRQIERLADCLDAFVAIKTPGMRHQQSPFLCPFTKPALGQRCGTFWLENRLGRS